MRISRSTSAAAAVGTLALVLAGCSTTTGASGSGNTYTTAEKTDGKTAFTQVVNPNGGQVLSFSTEGGMKIVEATSRRISVNSARPSAEAVIS